MSHALTTRAMIATLSIGIWQGYRLDRQASAEITAAKGAKSDAARVNKHLIAKEVLAPVVTASGAVRTHFYEKTLPWRDNGGRILSRLGYLPFIQEHEFLVGQFNDAVDTFLTEKYPAAIEQAEFRMGDMFDRSDYPTTNDLRRRFYATLDIDAVTTSNDFRVEIDSDHVDRVRAAMDQAAEKRLNDAMRDVWERIGKAVGNLHERLAQPDAVFRDTTVENVQDLIELIPGLNILDDPNIEQVRQAIAKAFTGVDAKEVRKDPAHREELAGEAKAIMDRMAGFMQAFGGGAA